jgi:thiosulfate reductase cytochrome b subunit
MQTEPTIPDAAPFDGPIPVHPVTGPLPAQSDVILRHRWPVRLWHWINAAAIIILLMTGLGIFNAHPRLYWGHFGSWPDAAWLELERFPGWMTIPSYFSLADSRIWHLFFALVLAFSLTVFMLWSLFFGHIRRDLHIGFSGWNPRNIWASIRHHATFSFVGKAESSYNLLQRLSYVGVIFVAIPLIILTGMTMSPGLNAGLPWLVDLFGGRQSARSLHFIVAGALSAFLIVHLIMVLLANPLQLMRSMITGWLRPAAEEGGHHG